MIAKMQDYEYEQEAMKREALADEIKDRLPYFCNGTEDYYRSSGLARDIFHTDGVKYLATKAKAYWLIDAIVSYQFNKRIRREPFQVWTLKVDGSQAVLICGDGNDMPPLITQKIQYTDFPLNEITLYLEDGSLDGEHLAKILMLPSER